MDLVCPLCNGINTIEVNCTICGARMVDKGPVTDYLDDYSPYLPFEITQMVDGGEHDKCVHIFQCTNCNYDKRIEINKVKL